MKQIATLIILCFVVYNCDSQNQTFEIFGTFKGINKGYICIYSKTRKDSACVEIKNEKFYFKRNAVLPILFHFDLGGFSLVHDIFIDSSKTTVDLLNTTKSNGGFHVVSVKGSANENLKSGFQKWVSGQKELKLPKKKFNSKYYDKLVKLVKNNNKALASIYLVSQSYNLDYNQIVTLTNLLDKSLDNTQEKKDVKELLNYIDKSKNEFIGTLFLDIDLSDTTGKIINIKDFKGKIVLIDFWASYCKPCVAHIPDYKNLYAKFKSKQFEILGISRDKKNNDWKKAIVKYNVNWTQAIEKNNVVLADKYNIQSIPSNFLIDKNGKIIGYNLTVPEIEAVLLKEK